MGNRAYKPTHSDRIKRLESQVKKLNKENIYNLHLNKKELTIIKTALFSQVATIHTTKIIYTIKKLLK